MRDDTQDLLAEMTSRYAEQRLPWDAELPPPEVIELAQTLPPGRALDLGCGLGRACLFLARHGWQCDGVDFVDQAIMIARQRAKQAGLGERITFHQASVSELDFLEHAYDVIVDVGCLHAQAPDVQVDYAWHAARLLKPGGHFLLFAHLRHEPDNARWVPAIRIEQLFAEHFTIERREDGSTTVGDNTWPSAWFWMRRR